MSDDLRTQRVERLLAARPAVAREVRSLGAARDGSLEGSRAIARRLRPSGGLGKELREHPLQVVGLLVALALLGLRWVTSVRRGRASEALGGSGVASAFAAGLAAAAAERGGRAVIDALLDPRASSVRVDETSGSAHDDQGRVAKR